MTPIPTRFEEYITHLNDATMLRNYALWLSQRGELELAATARVQMRVAAKAMVNAARRVLSGPVA